MKVECVICEKEIELLLKFNGEMMCEECYNKPANYVFEGDVDNEETEE